MEKGFTVLTTAVCLAALLFIVIGGPCHLPAQKEVVMTRENSQTQLTKALATTNLPKPWVETKAIPQESAQPFETETSVSPDRQIGPAIAQEPGNGALAVSKPWNTPYAIEDLLFGEIVLFSTTENAPYAAVKVENRIITAPTDSHEFKIMIAQALYQNNGSVPAKMEINKAVHYYHYMALLSTFKFLIETRCAMFGDAIYIDLGDASGDRVKITKDGWVIEPAELAPPFFKRQGGMLPLPRPEKGGSIKELAGFLNLGDRSEDHFKLIAGWLVDALYPGGPYIMMVLNGPQGSGKTITLKLLRDLIDPAEAAMLSLPTSERDMFIAGSRTYLLSYDNVSKLKNSLSDAFCRMINDDTFRTRKLYTNVDEIIIKLRRSAIFSGIPNFVKQNDFMDRAIFIELPPIHPARRRTEKDLSIEWQKVRSRILGALYDLVAVALRNHATVQPQNLPRIADSARWITAAESEGLWETGSFLEAYQDNRQGMVDLALESDPAAVGISALMKFHPKWSGTTTELLQELHQVMPETLRKSKEFPKAPNALSNRIMRLEGFLADRDIVITRTRQPNKRIITITRINGEAASSDKAGSGIRHKDTEDPAAFPPGDSAPAEIREIDVKSNGSEAGSDNDDSAHGGFGKGKKNGTDDREYF